MPSFSAPPNASPPSANPRPPTTDPASGSESPIAPPYSPITPVLRTAALPSTLTTAATAPPPSTSTTAAPDAPAPPHRAPTPVRDSTNPDAIALRAALSALQIQRLRAACALRTLQRQKRVAVGEPVRFARALGRGRIRSAASGNTMLGSAAVTGVGNGARRERKGDEGAVDVAVTSDDDESDEDEEEGEGKGGEEEDGATLERFGAIPTPQAVVRCPPVNWAKYHVAGGALDRLHREQRRWPEAGQPAGGGAGTQGTGEKEGRRVHVVAAPYSPWRDEVASAAARRRPTR